MKKDFFNLNHECVFISDFESGNHQNITIKLGKCFYLLDISKNAKTTFLDFYKRVAEKRETFSKYDKRAELTFLVVQNSAILDRKFFENAKAIRACQDFLAQYDSILRRW